MSKARKLDDPSAWLAGLREAYARSIDEGARYWRAAMAAAAAEPDAASGLATAALEGLSTMAEDDPTSLGMSACEALRRFGGAVELDGLRAVQPSLPARRGLRDWRADARTAIEVMEARVAGRCTCGVEASRKSGPYGEQWQELGPSVADEYGSRVLSVECTHCGSRWKVRRDDSYHYPIFSWTRAG